MFSAKERSLHDLKAAAKGLQDALRNEPRGPFVLAAIEAAAMKVHDTLPAVLRSYSRRASP